MRSADLSPPAGLSASGRINPKKDFAVQFLSGTHLIGTDNATVKP